MGIVTSLHVYNFHLIISYLGKGIQIVQFNDFQNKFKKVSYNYSNEINTKKSLLDLTTYSHQLFGIEDSEFKSFSLFNKENNANKNFLKKIKTSQISLDFAYSDLYLLSEIDGIHELSIRNPLKPKQTNHFIPESFEKLGNPIISNMVSENRNVFLAYRGFGASKIEKDSSEIFKETVYRSEDAQDIRFFSKYNLILIADALEGLLLFDPKESIASRKIRLSETDFPQEIKPFMGNALIKGKKGLYIFNLYHSKLEKIWEGPVGALTTYFNNIFFSSNGKINLLSNSNDGRIHFQLKDMERLDIEIKKYMG